MSYSLDEIFNQAKKTYLAKDVSNGDEEAYIYRGVRVSRLLNTVYICDASRGDYYNYSVLDEQIIDTMISHGFVYGVYVYLYNKYSKSISRLSGEQRIEVNTNNNSKTIKSLRNKRNELLIRYFNLKKQKMKSTNKQEENGLFGKQHQAEQRFLYNVSYCYECNKPYDNRDREHGMCHKCWQPIID